MCSCTRRAVRASIAGYWWRTAPIGVRWKPGSGSRASASSGSTCPAYWPWSRRWRPRTRTREAIPIGWPATPWRYTSTSAAATRSSCASGPSSTTSARSGCGAPSSSRTARSRPARSPTWRSIRRWGSRSCARSSRTATALDVVRHHHERWDGAGYPDGLAGPDIPLGARIVAMADAFDAMTTLRPYRGARSPEQAIAEIQRRPAASSIPISPPSPIRRFLGQVPEGVVMRIHPPRG
jgi:hypothetical protein